MSFFSMAEIATTILLMSNMLFRHVLGNQENSWQDYGGLRFLHSSEFFWGLALCSLQNLSIILNHSQDNHGRR